MLHWVGVWLGAWQPVEARSKMKQFPKLRYDPSGKNLLSRAAALPENSHGHPAPNYLLEIFFEDLGKRAKLRRPRPLQFRSIPAQDLLCSALRLRLRARYANSRRGGFLQHEAQSKINATTPVSQMRRVERTRQHPQSCKIAHTATLFDPFCIAYPKPGCSPGGRQ